MHSPTNVIAFPIPTGNHGLRRPRILIRAAREGQQGWRRQRDLPRLLRSEACPPPGRVLGRLRAEEEALNIARKTARGDYDLNRHILLLIAILAEMQATMATVAQPVGDWPDWPLSVPGTAIPARP